MAPASTPAPHRRWRGSRRRRRPAGRSATSWSAPPGRCSSWPGSTRSSGSSSASRSRVPGRPPPPGRDPRRHRVRRGRPRRRLGGPLPHHRRDGQGHGRPRRPHRPPATASRSSPASASPPSTTLHRYDPPGPRPRRAVRLRRARSPRTSAATVLAIPPAPPAPPALTGTRPVDGWAGLRGVGAGSRKRSMFARSSGESKERCSAVRAKSRVARTARSRCMLRMRLVSSTAPLGEAGHLLGAGHAPRRTPRRRGTRG